MALNPITRSDQKQDYEEGWLGELESINDCEKVLWYPESRKYSRRELFLDQVVLILGALFGCVATPMLLWKSTIHGGDEALKVSGFCVYSLGLCAMLDASLLFNRYAHREGWFATLLAIDTISINLMIAGSYTPLCFYVECWHLLYMVWLLAFIGIGYQLVNFGVPLGERKNIDLFLFLVMGWSVMLFYPQVFPHISELGGRCLLACGILCTVGAGFNQWQSLEFHKVVWHVLVLAATVIIYVWFYADFAGVSKLDGRTEYVSDDPPFGEGLLTH